MCNDTILNRRKFQVTLLGMFELSGEGGVLDEEKIRSDMLTKLLVYIFSHRKDQLTIQELSDALWQDAETSDNPAGALKNLMYRLRTLLKKEWNDIEFIVTGRGTYMWNPDIELAIDVDEFEQFYKEANKAEDESVKIDLLKKAIAIYKGEFVPKLAMEYWAASQATYYHSVFMSAVSQVGELLVISHRYTELEEIAQGAIQKDTLEERFYTLFIKALIGQNKHKLAVEQYQKAKKLLYETLGIQPSKELRSAYEELMKEKNEQEKGLDIIQHDLRQEDDGESAFLCEYGVFKKTYHLECRRAGRMGMSIYLVLFTAYPTLQLQKESEAYLNTVNGGMDTLESVLLSSLRTGDVISRYSSSQFIIMLPACRYEDAVMVTKRVQDKFYQTCKKKVRLRYSIEEIQLKAEEDKKEL